MRFRRLAELAIAGLLGGAIGWVLGSSADNDSVADADADAGNQPIPAVRAEQEPSDGLTPSAESDRALDELSAALAQKERQLVEAEAALAQSLSALADANAAVEAAEKYPESVGMAYLDIKYVGRIFEAQAVDRVWAEQTETEIYGIIAQALTSLNLAVAGNDVDCRTDICRVLITHATTPVLRAEFQALGDAVEEVARRVIDESPGITTTVSNNRTGFAGELTTSEIFLYRRGNADPINFFETPTVSNRIGAPEL